MRFRMSRLGVGVALLVLIVGLSGVSRGQGPSSDPAALAAQAIDQEDRGDFELAISTYQKIAQAVPGTVQDARAQMQLAYISATYKRDFASARLFYQGVITRFPSHPYAFEAKSNLMDFDYWDGKITLDEWIRRMDLLIQQAGGPSLSRVQQGDLSLKAVSGLNPAYQKPLLGDLYDLVACRLLHAKNVSTQSLKQAENIFVFLAANFTDGEVADVSEPLRQTILMEEGNYTLPFRLPQDSTPPRVRALRARHNGRVSRRPLVRAVVSDGDILQSQANPKSFAVEVDGTRISGTLKFKEKVRKRGSEFATFVIHFFPDSRLAVGTHTVKVTIADRAGNLAIASVLWRVYDCQDGRGPDDGWNESFDDED